MRTMSRRKMMMTLAKRCAIECCCWVCESLFLLLSLFALWFAILSPRPPPLSDFVHIHWSIRGNKMDKWFCNEMWKNHCLWISINLQGEGVKKKPPPRGYGGGWGWRRIFPSNPRIYKRERINNERLVMWEASFLAVVLVTVPAVKNGMKGDKY